MLGLCCFVTRIDDEEQVFPAQNCTQCVNLNIIQGLWQRTVGFAPDKIPPHTLHFITAKLHQGFWKGQYFNKEIQVDISILV